MMTKDPYEKYLEEHFQRWHAEHLYRVAKSLRGLLAAALWADGDDEEADNHDQ
jgi:hypothetical protein